MRLSIVNSSLFTILTVAFHQCSDGVATKITSHSSNQHPPHNRPRRRHDHHDYRKVIENSSDIPSRKNRKRRLRRHFISEQNEKDETYQSHSTKQRKLLDLSEIFSLYGKLTDEVGDADADDYYDNLIISQEEDKYLLYHNNTNTTLWFNQTFSNMIPKSSISHKTKWYELSHYIEPDSAFYDIIEGFFIAVLVCLIVATCYNYCYYYCLIRCGLVEDDRIYKSLLHRKGRKVRQLLITRKRGRRRRVVQELQRMKSKNRVEKKSCCSSFSICFCRKKSCNDGYGNDGNGLFVPLNADRGRDRYEDYAADDDDDSLDSWDSDNSSSSLSQDSALSLEYGDKEVFDDDCGENNEHYNDEKLKDAAKTFFDQQEKKEQMKKGKSKVGIMLTQEQKMKMKTGTRSIGSRRSRKSRRSSRGTSVRSQASSILSSDSGSLSSFNEGSSSDEDDDHSLEMEAAMMDLELAEQRMSGNC